MVVGTALWAVFAAVVGARAILGYPGTGTALATGVAGVALGGIGYAIFFLQRRCVRRGTGRGQRGLT